MAQYRKKPVVIEAVKYMGKGFFDDPDVPAWVFEAFEDGTLVPTMGADPLYVKTLEGAMEVPPGNFIIQGVEGELYSCEPNIFAKTYEEVK